MKTENEDKDVTIEIEIKYINNINGKFHNIQSVSSKIILDDYQSQAQLSLPKEKIKGTFIENELHKTNGGDRYIRITLESKSNFLSIDSLIDCFEIINEPNYDIAINQSNIISYLYAFSITKLENNKLELLNKFKSEVDEINIIPLIQAISSLKQETFYPFIYYLLKHIINKQNNIEGIKFEKIDYDNITKIVSSYNKFSFDEKRIIYKNLNGNLLASNLSFLKEFHNNLQKKKSKFYEVNNYFNIGKVFRRKNNDGLLSDYPHYYELTVENDADIRLYALREAENSNFIISTNIDDFTKFGPSFLGEIEANFWGTSFIIYDNGYPEGIYQKVPNLISNQRQNFGSISYETNIMGECPRIFKIDVNNFDPLSNTYHNVHMENLKPEWNIKMDCYTLNFYGRVKKASAKNFQIIIPGDTDNILLQHGKVSKNEFNLDFREPFSPLFAFAVSLAAIGKKRVVS